MCGRYVLIEHAIPLAEQFELFEAVALTPRYNLAPTDVAPIVRVEGGRRVLRLARFGLVPSWAKDLAVGSRAINARAETLAEKPTFREAFSRRRCIVPASGFYEWAKTGGRRQPYVVRERSGRYLAMAGLWDRWRGAGGEAVESFSIVTCPANAAVAALHDRMPVLLSAPSYDAWLDPEAHDAAALRGLLVPSPAELLERVAVDPYVNRVGNEGPRCLAPAASAQLELFGG